MDPQITVPSGNETRLPRVLVVGCGGIGGIVTASLAHRAGAKMSELVALSTNGEIAAITQRDGLSVQGAGESFVTHARVLSQLAQDEAPFDFVLLCTQPTQVEEAAQGVLAWLAPRGAMVCLQNGLCEQRIARIAGADRVLGAVVAWGASMPSPGRYERTSRGGFMLGSLQGGSDPRLRVLEGILEAVGPIKITENLAGVRFSKLAINSAISTLGTLGGATLGSLLRHTLVRRLALEIMTETVAVARAEGVQLEKVAGTLNLDWMALRDHERRGGAGLMAKHAVLLAVGAKYRRMRSSMLAAIERGRPPAVDFLNGEVVVRGERCGVPTPVNKAATARVHALARREAAPGYAQIEALARDVGLL
ncbi:MAG: 2-dehydropantoate 2-reductase [Deltaproteobacteria bacterium]|nr:2-dehydropantoate 2-reductase [Deltaproteobacteria bacterium]